MKLNSLVIYTDQTVIMFFLQYSAGCVKHPAIFIILYQWTSGQCPGTGQCPHCPLLLPCHHRPSFLLTARSVHIFVTVMLFTLVATVVDSDSLGLLTHFYNLLCWYRPGQHWVTQRGVNWEIICTAVYTPVYTAVQTLNKARSPPDTAPSLVQLLTGLCIKYILIVSETSETSETVETLPPCNN